MSTLIRESDNYFTQNQLEYEIAVQWNAFDKIKASILKLLQRIQDKLEDARYIGIREMIGTVHGGMFLGDSNAKLAKIKSMKKEAFVLAKFMKNLPKYGSVILKIL